MFWLTVQSHSHKSDRSIKTAKYTYKLRLEHALRCMKGLMCLNRSNSSIPHGMTGQVTSMAAVHVGVCQTVINPHELLWE